MSICSLGRAVAAEKPAEDCEPQSASVSHSNHPQFWEVVLLFAVPYIGAILWLRSGLLRGEPDLPWKFNTESSAILSSSTEVFRGDAVWVQAQQIFLSQLVILGL